VAPIADSRATHQSAPSFAALAIFLCNFLFPSVFVARCEIFCPSVAVRVFFLVDLVQPVVATVLLSDWLLVQVWQTAPDLGSVCSLAILLG
jgi:hypothetical protein